MGITVNFEKYLWDVFKSI